MSGAPFRNGVSTGCLMGLGIFLMIYLLGYCAQKFGWDS